MNTKTTPRSRPVVDVFQTDMSARPKPLALDGHITPRENHVVQLLSHGLDNHQIAETLELSIETVKEHVANVLRKTGFTNRTMLAVWWVTGRHVRITK